MRAPLRRIRERTPSRLSARDPEANLRVTEAEPSSKVSAATASKLDEVIPQATQLPILNRLVELVVLGERDPRWLQEQIGFSSQRNVYYYLEAARWARLIREEGEIAATNLGRRYVLSRFCPGVVLEGMRGRPLFESVLRASKGHSPTPAVVEGVLRRWSFRYSKTTVARRARDFCTLFGPALQETSVEPRVCGLAIVVRLCESRDIPAIDRCPLLWPALLLCPVPGLQRSSAKKEQSSPQLNLFGGER